MGERGRHSHIQRNLAIAVGGRLHVILDQDAIRATVFAREGDEWLGRILRSGGLLSMPEISVSMPLDEPYEGVDLGAGA